MAGALTALRVPTRVGALSAGDRSSMSAKAFDPVVYKETTRKQWQDAAAAWDRWSDVLERWLGPATEVMLDMAGIVEGGRVLDVAAGKGGPGVAAGRRG